MKDVPFVNRRYTKRGTFSVKNGIEKGKAGLDLGAEHHRIKLCWVLPRGSNGSNFQPRFRDAPLRYHFAFKDQMLSTFSEITALKLNSSSATSLTGSVSKFHSTVYF